MSLVFVVNSGSSSIKYQLLDTDSGDALEEGVIQRIGESGGDAESHEVGLRKILDSVGRRELAAVGHRVVHGGSRFDRAVIVTDEVEADIEELSALAPLHNPANLAGIRAARAAVPGVPQVAVFDTAFHQSMPRAAYRYAIDRGLADRWGIRRYGFHGTSHKYVSERAAVFLGRPLDRLRQIVLHLGNGASACAIRGGISVDTSMGMTPLEGLVMGTRSGDLDPAILPHLGRVAGLELPALDEILNRRSGLLGLAGSGDMRDVLSRSEAGDDAAEEALEVWAHRIRHYLGAYLAVLGGVDAITFTAGIGENTPALRARALQGLDGLGIVVDDERNASASRAERRISPAGADVAVLVIPTNEELEIARQSAAAVEGQDARSPLS